MVTKWSNEEDDLLRGKWEECEGSHTLLLPYFPQRSLSSLRNRSHFLKLKRGQFSERKPWTAEEDATLKRVFAESSREDLSLHLPGRTADACLIRGYKIGVGQRPTALSPYGSLAPLLQESCQSAYWIGFLMADGHLTETGRLQVILSSKDHMHLQKLADFLGDGIVIRCKVNAEGFSNVSLALQDKVNAALLSERFDWVSNKTYNPPKQIPYRNINLLRSWLIGFIDGDGSINYQSNGRKTVMLRTTSHISWNDLLERVSLTLEFGSIRYRNAGKYVTISCYKQSDIKALKMYAIDKDLPILHRKWDRVI